MAKYLFLKHYRGAPAAVNDVPMDQWAPAEIEAHMQYMEDFADRLRESGEYVNSQALASEGAWVRYDGEGKPPVTDGPRAGLAALAELNPTLPRYTASAAYLHERAGDTGTAAELYVEAAAQAHNLAERNHLTLRAATLRLRITGEDG